MNKMAILTVTAILVTITGILGTLAMSGIAHAQIEKDPGASGLTPDLPPNDAPGIAAGPHCIGCAKSIAPGSEGLDSGAIGSKK